MLAPYLTFELRSNCFPGRCPWLSVGESCDQQMLNVYWLRLALTWAWRRVGWQATAGASMLAVTEAVVVTDLHLID